MFFNVISIKKNRTVSTSNEHIFSWVSLVHFSEYVVKGKLGVCFYVKVFGFCWNVFFQERARVLQKCFNREWAQLWLSARTSNKEENLLLLATETKQFVQKIKLFWENCVFLRIICFRWIVGSSRIAYNWLKASATVSYCREYLKSQSFYMS